MEQSLLDYIILGLIIAVIIYLLIQMISNSRSEHMSKSLSENPTSYVEEEPSEPKIRINPSPTGLTCKVDKMQSDVDKYIGDIVYGDRFRCIDKSDPFSRSDVDAYQNGVFGFADDINRSSSQANVDPVDMMNQYLVSPTGENANKSIADVYDMMTANNQVDGVSPNNFENMNKMSDTNNFFEQNVPSENDGFFNLRQVSAENFAESLEQSSGDRYLNIDHTFNNGLLLNKTDMGNYYSECNWDTNNCTNPSNDVSVGGIFYDNVSGNSTLPMHSNMALMYKN